MMFHLKLDLKRLAVNRDQSSDDFCCQSRIIKNKWPLNVYYIELYCLTICYTAMYCILLCLVELYCIVLKCIELTCIIMLICYALHCIELHCIAFFRAEFY